MESEFGIPPNLRILLTEGSSTSAREAITVLGEQGHRIEICDPDPFCIGRFSRFVSRHHRCPGLGVDPEGYVAFVLKLVKRRRFDVLLPIHEQGLALSRIAEQLRQHVAVALPTFEAYEKACTKTGFSALLCELGLPQPRTSLIKTPAQIRLLGEFPIVLKAAIGTASHGVWIVRDVAELANAADDLEEIDAFEDHVLLQEWVDAPIEHAQAVFSHGHLLGMHAYRQMLRGAGGGDAAKQSVSRPTVRNHLAHLGRELEWHGALSVDYLFAEGRPLYIDCNPRLVEPMSSVLADHDLLSLLLAVTLNHSSAPLDQGQTGVRSHLALQSLLGCAARTHSRRELVREAWRLFTARGQYAGSQEELTPVRRDWLCVVPLGVAFLWLIVSPTAAHHMAHRRWREHLLNAASMKKIRQGFPALVQRD